MGARAKKACQNLLWIMEMVVSPKITNYFKTAEKRASV